MCRMVGVVSRGDFPTEVLNDLKLVSETGKIPDRTRLGHRDGWGLAAFIKGSPKYLGRSPIWAARDPSYDAAVSKASDLRGPSILIGHVRAASRGKASIANTHPFIAGGVMAGHNGTTERFHPATSRRPRGDTDSELFVLALADRYKKERDMGEAMRSVILEEVLDHEFTGAVFLASDGKLLCGYRDYSLNGRYYDLNVAASRGHVVLYQETALGVNASRSRVARGEMVTVGKDLRVEKRSIR